MFSFVPWSPSKAKEKRIVFPKVSQRKSRVRVLLRSARPDRSSSFSDNNNGVSRYWVSRVDSKELCVNLRVASFWLMFYSSVTSRVTDPSLLSYFLTPASSSTRLYLHLYKGKTSSLWHHSLVLVFSQNERMMSKTFR